MELMEEDKEQEKPGGEEGDKEQEKPGGEEGDKEQEKPGGKMKTKTRNRSSPRLRDMSWKSPRLMERMDIIYQSRPL